MEATGPSEYQRNYRPWVVRGGGGGPPTNGNDGSGAPLASAAPERTHRMADRTTLRPRPPGPVSWVHDETMAHALDAARNHAEYARRYKENATGGAMAVAGVSRDASPTHGAVAAAHARATVESAPARDVVTPSPGGSPTRPAFKAPASIKGPAAAGGKVPGSPIKSGSPQSAPLPAPPPTTVPSAIEDVPSSDVPTCHWKPGPVPKQYHTVYHKEYQGTPGPQYKPQWVNSHQRNFESPTCVPLPARESSSPKPGHATASSGGRTRSRSVSPGASRDPDATRPTPTLYETRIGMHTAPTVYHMPAGVARQLMQGRLGAPQPSPPGYMLPNIFGESAPERTPRAPSPPPKNMAITPAAGLTSNESALVFTGSSLPPRRRAGAKPAVIDAEGTLPMPVPGLLSDQVDHTWTALGSGAAKGSSPPARNEASRTPSPTRCVKTLPAI
ncbi:hypothetical protein AMAG_05947 [Allomyces macrogynus ATCC 38327]|uniref:Uncharacterized protein n=1 Tax=Allomyces macrogynus (strain ATCC 38327) TaxID=578462 RepID=A0A0L0SDR7_ALLM3|nr:hypothetical protein AMAG_05947 [Allomyces macrogynus ATCC 38327]|eukprot:KNE60569.1 hypothetical protein AMAG_05947 [Allomyces macrogynus ATCC 38327]